MNFTGFENARIVQTSIGHNFKRSQFRDLEIIESIQ